MATTGRWNVGGFNIPDFGLVDFKNKKLGANTGNIGGKVSVSGNKATYDLGNKTITGSILGASTSSRTPATTTTTQAPSNYSTPIRATDSGGDGGDSGVDSSGLRDEISSGWDQYIRGLDDQLGGLSNSRSAQEGIVNSQYNQGVNTLGLQRDQGMQELGSDRTAAMQNQTSNLRDIAGNIRNAFQAGNVYLGARGAGDSSAANQYSYALNKMGTQQRSDVMNNTANILADVDARESNLNNIYSTEINNLGEQKNQQIQQVGVWFADAQNQIKQMQAEGRLRKSQDLSNLSKDLLNQAIARVNQIEQMSMNRKQALDQWAMGVSENIGQLRSNMQKVSQVDYSMPQAQQIAGAPQVDSSGNMATNFGGGGGLFNEERDKFKLFG